MNAQPKSLWVDKPRFWNEARDASLRFYASMNYSASEIASHIGYGCTRGMVSSRCRTLKVQIDGGQRAKLKNRAKWLRRRIANLSYELSAIESQITPPALRVSRETVPQTVIDRVKAFFQQYPPAPAKILK